MYLVLRSDTDIYEFCAYLCVLGLKHSNLTTLWNVTPTYLRNNTFQGQVGVAAKLFNVPNSEEEM